MRHWLMHRLMPKLQFPTEVAPEVAQKTVISERQIFAGYTFQGRGFQ